RKSKTRSVLYFYFPTGLIYNLVPVGNFIKEEVKTIDPRNTPDEIFDLWSIPAYDAGSPEIIRGGDVGSQKKVVFPNDVLISRIIPHIRRACVVPQNSNNRRQIASTEWIIFSSDEIVPEFLQNILVSDHFHTSFMQTITGVGGSLSRANPSAVGEIKIPLPPITIQKEIVTEIEGYQKVINGARAVIDNYRPHIAIAPDWEIVKLSDVTESISDGDHMPPPKAENGIPFITISNINKNNQIDFSKTFFVPEEYYEALKPHRKPQKDDILYTVTGSYGIPVLIESDIKFCFQRHIGLIRASAKINTRYLYYLLSSRFILNQADSAATGVAQKTVSLTTLRDFSIPVPPIEIQKAIVAEIEAEQALVNANRELIERFEKKIQTVLNRIWGGE
ncbi:MAG: restriction endonuclease subunit S, partial [Pseudanabaena sp. ELA645]